MSAASTGERIRALRIQKGMSQEELGSRVGLKKAAINKYETGVVVNLKRSVIAKLADVLETSPAYLMGWDGVLEEAKEIKERHREAARQFGDGVTLTGDNDDIIIFKHRVSSGQASKDEERLLLAVYHLAHSQKDRHLHTLRILSELVSVMSPEDQDKLVSYAEFMEADRQKHLGISVQHPYQYEQE